MAKTISMKVSPKLLDACNVVGKAFADDVKKKYDIKELFVPNTLATELIAGKILSHNKWNFRVHKTSRDSGILELVY